MKEGIPPLKILKVPEENIYHDPIETNDEAGRLEQLASLREAVKALENEAAHPVPGAMRVNHEEAVLEKEKQIHALEGKDPKRVEKEKKVKLTPEEEIRAQIKTLEDEAAHPVPGAMKNPDREAQILALEEKLHGLEKERATKAEKKEEKVEAKPKVEEPKAKEPKAEELPLAVPVGAPYVPEGVKTNEQLKKEFFDGKEKPKQEIDPLAQQPGESMRDFLNRRVGQRNSELEAELAAKPWTTAGVMNWWKERAQEYNTFSFGDKMVTGGIMLGAAVGAGALTGSALAALGVAMPWRAFKGVAAGLGTYGLSEALIERSKQKKIAKGIEPGAIARNKKKVSTIIGATVGTIVGTGALGWLSHLFGGEEHAATAAGKALEHHFNPSATVEVKPGHGAISMVHDLQMKLEHLYEHADPKTIPPAAAAIMHGDPTKIAEQLQAYQPDAFKNSELIAKHAHLGIGSDGTLLYEAHGLDHPVTLMNADGSAATGWNDHMMRPGAHGHGAAHHGGVDRATDTSASNPNSPQVHEMNQEVTHSNLNELWTAHHDASTLKEIVKAAPSMPVNQELVSNLINAKEATTYLLHDGRVAIFGSTPGDVHHLFTEQHEFAKAFAAKLGTDVSIHPEAGYGQLIVHSDGTETLDAVTAHTPDPKGIVMQLAH